MNPYEVLGVPENATDEQVKEAYKELVKKYHPDRYQNNPLADLAEEKLQEINQAYDLIMSDRGRSHTYSRTGTGAAADYSQVRRNIDAGNLAAAESILNNAADRSAEWYFLSGVIANRKGWYDEALTKMQTACNMEPSNMEYRRYLASLRGRGGQYQNTAMGKGFNNNDMCCQALQCYICADCCCDCI